MNGRMCARKNVSRSNVAPVERNPVPGWDCEDVEGISSRASHLQLCTKGYGRGGV